MSRVRMPGVHGYRSAPDFAWSGWRYRIPGGPVGGQYHGFIGPDSTQSWEGGHGGWPGGRSEIAEGPQRRPSGHSLLPGQGDPRGPWDNNWGGTAFDEGETHSDYVYRSPAEMRPRPNASGGVNVIFGNQDETTAGYAEAPGNYRGLGMMMPLETPIYSYPVPVARPMPSMYTPPTVPIATTFPVAVARPLPQLPPGPSPSPAPTVYNPFTGPDMQRLPYIPTEGSGATNIVRQPGPPSGPWPTYMVPWTPPPVSPAPAPSVQATPADYYPSQGQVVDGLTPGTPSAPSAAPTNFTEWLGASTIIPGVQNQWLALGALAAFMMLNSGKGKR